MVRNTNIPQQHPSTERCKLYQLYLPYQRPPRCHYFLSCRPSFLSCGWQSESYFWLEMLSRTQARLWCVQFSACEEVCCTELYTEGQIAIIAFGSVGAPLYRHEKRDENNSNSVMIISWLLMNFELSRWFKSCFHNLQQNKIYQG